MAVPLAHPDAEQLQAFNRGRLDDEAVTSIGAHLDTCADCRRALESLVGDTLEDLVRAADTSPASGECVEPVPAWLEYFRVERVLGQGGMGRVYLADDTRLHRQVALKTLRGELARKPGARDRFLREARAAAALEHDHVVPIYYVGEADGTPFLAMPLLKGQSLEDYRKQAGGKLEPAVCVRLARQIAAGLAAAHRRGLIHRDIKPTNLWVEPDQGGRVKILDFGLAKTANAPEALTHSGTIVGTPAYMAPEQARGQPVDGRADLFSLGCVLYELLTGRQPFTGPDVMAILNSLAVDIPAAPHTLEPRCPPALSALVMRLLGKDPAARPASAEAVIAELEKLPAEGANAVSAPHATGRKRRRGLLVAVAAGLLLLAGGGMLLPQLIIRITDRQGKTREVEVKPGEKVEIVQKQPADKQKAVPARSELVAPDLDGDPDRRAAAYVVSIGGRITVRVNDQDRDISAVEDLPKEVFHITSVSLDRNPRVTDSGLVSFKGCKDVTSLTVHYTPLGDAGLACFKDSKNLQWLGLVVTQVTDAGLAHFHGWKNLSYLDLRGTQVTDAGLAHFKDCKNLTIVFLQNRRVTDAGLTHFKDCKNLMQLALESMPVTDTGLAHFKNCRNLSYLNLAATQVTDAGLAQFKNCRNLAGLDLGATRVTDAGLAHFKDCKNLTHLELAGTQVTDAGLAHLKDCKNLKIVVLSGTRVTDAGLGHLKDCKSLSYVNLRATRVTDAGLAHFKDCKTLSQLFLTRTQVTDRSLPWISGLPVLVHIDLGLGRISRLAYERFKAAHPGIVIQWSERNHDVAQAVLNLRGRVEIGSLGQAETRPVKEADDLIADYFQVRRVSLAGVKKPLDAVAALLGQLRDPKFDRLERLDLSRTNVPDLAFLDGVHGPDELVLAEAGLDDTRLGRLPRLPLLKRLVLDRNDIRASGLRHLTLTQPQLVDLSLACPSIDTTAALQLAEMKGLKRLSLAGSAMSDAGLKRLERLANLQDLDLRKTKATAAGVERLRRALPACRVTWDGGVIDPARRPRASGADGK